jgi:hypothetical protein
MPPPPPRSLARSPSSWSCLPADIAAANFAWCCASLTTCSGYFCLAKPRRLVIRPVLRKGSGGTYGPLASGGAHPALFKTPRCHYAFF